MGYIEKIFMYGRSQAVRIPKEFQFDCHEVCVRRQGEEIILSQKKQSWDDFFEQTSAFDVDFMADRDQVAPQERKGTIS